MNRPLQSHEEVWRRYDAIESELSAPLSERMLDLANLKEGMRVLDLATGRGEPLLRAAHRVGPKGRVVGVELSAPILNIAREKAAEQKLDNIELYAMNAEHLEALPDESFDAATARWCLMYMNDPIGALRQTHRKLKSGARLIAAMWAEPERVSYHSMPRKFLVHPAPAVDRSVPGPFYYDSVERIRRDFAAASLPVELIEELEVPVIESDTVQEIIDWSRAFGLTKLLNDRPASEDRAWEDAYRAALEASRSPATGKVALGGTALIVVARKH